MSVDLLQSADAVQARTRTFLAAFRTDRPADERPFELLSVSGSAASLAEDSSCTVLFAGGLFDRGDLVGRFGDGDSTLDDAELLLRIYRETGEDAISRIRGSFAVVIWDERRRALLFARDPLGHHSLFFGHAPGRLYFSDSIGTLVDHPDVSTSVDRSAIVDMIVHRQRDPDETFFHDVSRARAGWLYRVDDSGMWASRYWFPSDPSESAKWTTKDVAGRFDELLEQAVARPLAFGRSAVFLSGGIDSVSVAMVAADYTRKAGLPTPLALSLQFPGPDYDEKAIQTLVAERLGMPMHLIPFDQAHGQDDLIMAGLGVAETWPAPLVNPWQPLYTHLALVGKEQGVKTILTGAGGDEWLTTSPFWAAEALKRLDFGLVYHIWRTSLASYTLRQLPALRNLVWRYGLADIGRSAAVKVMTRVTPRRAAAIKKERYFKVVPDWVAPEPTLAEEIEERASSLVPLGSPRVRFVGEGLPLWEHPLQAMEQEEAFERGRRIGMNLFMPYWDVDLVDFLNRVPPRIRNEGYISKVLARRRLARRFPEAGFDQQKKVFATGLSSRRVFDEGWDVWEALGGPVQLAALGIIDPDRLQSRAEVVLGGSKDDRSLETSIETHQLWKVLNIEAWVRQWV